MKDEPKKKLTLKEIIDIEYKKCAVDPVHFMKKYCKIQHPTRGKINFNLYPFQEGLLQELENHRFNIINKGRQLGISTEVAVYALWKMTFTPDFNILVIATTQATAKNLVTKVKIAYDGLPSWLKEKTTEYNKLSMRFANGSRVLAAAGTEDSARSEALSLLIIDEAAFIENPDKVWISAQPTLSEGGSGIILSTPNGVGNFFHQKWIDSEDTGAMNVIKLPWSVHPDRGQAWRDEQTTLVGERAASQENDCSFITSGHTVIDGNILQWYKDTYEELPIETRGINGDYWIWEYPDYSKNYIITADIARGDGTDFSTFHVIEIESVTQVAEYKGKVSPSDFGHMLIAVATEYNEALLSIENTGIGYASVQIPLDAGYRNLYYSLKQPNYIDENLHIAKAHDMHDKSQLTPGFTMSTKTRPLVISKLEMYMLEKTPIIRSKRLLDELFVFVWTGHKAQARQGYNDDLVMAFSMGLWIRDTALKLRQRGIDLTKSRLSNFQKPIYTSLPKNTHPAWNIRHGKHNEDLRWLL